MHSLQLQEKKECVQKMWQEVLGHREMFNELLDEMKASRKSACQSKKDADAAKRRATRVARELQTLTEKYDGLKDDIRDEVNKVRALEEKVEEYEQVIEYMQHGYEELRGEYESIIDYMDHYIEKISPLYIRRCQVPNKGGQGGKCI